MPKNFSSDSILAHFFIRLPSTRIMYLLRLVRLPNLILIALSQFLVRYCIIMPAFQTEYNITGNFPEHLSKFEFALLVFSSLIIAAAGYIINDVFDVTADEFNKPGKNSIGKYVSEKSATISYFILSGIGVILGFYLAIRCGKITLGFVQLFVAASLWMYSSYYKKRMLSGNILISVLSALSLLIVGLFEPAFYMNFLFLFIYACFAFLVTFIREVIKDIEDLDGDERAQYKTFPVRFGPAKSKWLVYFGIALVAAFVVWVFYSFFLTNTVIDFWYLLAMFLVPFLALAYLVYSATEKKDFYYASQFTKIIMLFGILSMLPFYYFFLK